MRKNGFDWSTSRTAHQQQVFDLWVIVFRYVGRRVWVTNRTHSVPLLRILQYIDQSKNYQRYLTTTFNKLQLLQGFNVRKIRRETKPVSSSASRGMLTLAAVALMVFGQNDKLRLERCFVFICSKTISRISNPCFANSS